MKSLLRLSLILSVAAVSVSAMARTKWLTSYQKAVAESKKTGKPILANFTGTDWCLWCTILDKEVFRKKEFETWAAENVILLEVDFPERKKQTAALEKQNEILAKRYNVSIFPAILFLDASGKKLGSMGYESGGPPAWIKKAEALLAER